MQQLCSSGISKERGFWLCKLDSVKFLIYTLLQCFDNTATYIEPVIVINTYRKLKINFIFHFKLVLHVKTEENQFTTKFSFRI